MSSAIVESQVEAPHVVYPKGPIRKITSMRVLTDAVVGQIVMVTLACGHEATLVGHVTADSIVRCPSCFFERQRPHVVVG